jgi:hypothetical protein
MVDQIGPKLFGHMESCNLVDSGLIWRIICSFTQKVSLFFLFDISKIACLFVKKFGDIPCFFFKQDFMFGWVYSKSQVENFYEAACKAARRWTVDFMVQK